jgi:membrane-associated protease RseP (regulator of RpoE activity)
MRWSTFILGAALLVSGAVTPARAQEERADTVEREDCVCIATPSGRWVTPYAGTRDLTDVFWVNQRARLGVYVNRQANEDTDRYGALISGVTDGSPADKAGIQEGDIITKLDGESLTGGDEEYDEEESVPGMRLIERSRELEVGDTISVEYRRDGDTMTTDLVVGDFDRSAYSWGGEFPQMEAFGRSFDRLRELPEISVRAPQSFALSLGATLPGLELTELNPDLGEYFGTEEGVLVVSVPEENELDLKAGDVILQVDGRQVRSPSHAMRILRSYDADEEISLRIMRKQREMSVTGVIPERSGSGRHIIIERQDSK